MPCSSGNEKVQHPMPATCSIQPPPFTCSYSMRAGLRHQYARSDSAFQALKIKTIVCRGLSARFPGSGPPTMITYKTRSHATTPSTRSISAKSTTFETNPSRSRDSIFQSYGKSPTTNITLLIPYSSTTRRIQHFFLPAHNSPYPTYNEEDSLALTRWHAQKVRSRYHKHGSLHQQRKPDYSCWSFDADCYKLSAPLTLYYLAFSISVQFLGLAVPTSFTTFICLIFVLPGLRLLFFSLLISGALIAAFFYIRAQSISSTQNGRW